MGNRLLLPKWIRLEDPTWFHKKIRFWLSDSNQLHLFWQIHFQWMNGERPSLFMKSLIKKAERGELGAGNLTENGLVDRRLSFWKRLDLSYPFGTQQERSNFLIPRIGQNMARSTRYRATDLSAEWVGPPPPPPPQKGKNRRSLFSHLKEYDPTIFKLRE